MLSRKNQVCYGASIAEFWKDSDAALQTTDEMIKTVTLLKSHFVQSKDDFELEKAVDPDYVECFHRKLDSKEKCLNIALREADCITEKVRTKALEVIQEIQRPSFPDSTLDRLKQMNYNTESVQMCQEALLEQRTLLEMKKVQLQNRSEQLKKSAEEALKALDLARKKDQQYKSRPVFLEPKETPRIEKKEVLASLQTDVDPKKSYEVWMIRASLSDIKDLGKFHFQDRFVGYLQILLSRKGEISTTAPKEEGPQLKKVTFVVDNLPEGMSGEPSELERVECLSPGSVTTEGGLDSQDNGPKPFEIERENLSLPIEDPKNFDLRKEIASTSSEIISKNNKFRKALGLLEGSYGNVLLEMDQFVTETSEISKKIQLVTQDVNCRHNPQHHVTASLYLASFKDDLRDGFRRYLKLQKSALDIAKIKADYTAKCSSFNSYLIDSETIETLEGFRFPTALAKECLFVVGWLKQRMDQCDLLEKKIQQAQNCLMKALDLAVLAEKNISSQTFVGESWVYNLRSGYVYFEEGLKNYRESLEQSQSLNSESKEVVERRES